jgi:hypothetical protein
MSNPAVIMLTNTTTNSGGRFKVEDNIGESMHIHYDNFRIDLTIKEFLEFSEVIEESLANLLNNNSFNIKNFDPSFLHDISHMLINMESVTFENIQLSDLIVSKKGFLGVEKWASLNQSKVYRAIYGDDEENNNYLQTNFVNQNNQERVDTVKKLIKERGYPINDEYIVLFNNQNHIRDGQHRAASILSVRGNIEIPIIRLKFENNNYNLKENRWITSFIPSMKGNAKKSVRKIVNRVKVLKLIINNLRS